MAKQVSPEELTTHISMWGPTSSGKDWLFKGFIKELEYFNDTHKNFQMVLSEYPRGQEQPNPLIIARPESDPTRLREDKNWLFERRPLLQDDRHLVSGFKHRIIFHNASGGDLLKSIYSKGQLQGILNVLCKSRYILILLDPTFSMSDEYKSVETPRNQEHQDSKTGQEDDEFQLLDDNNMRSAGDSPYQQEEGMAQTSGINREDYLRFLQGLLDKLALHQDNMPKRSLAVCMTKMDQFQYADPDPWNLLLEIFGKGIYNLFRSRRDQFDVRIFPTTAAGFIYHMGKSEPNIRGMRLQSGEEWEPINCSQPFFWFFFNSEMEKIEESSNFFFNNKDKYIPYPPLRNI